MTPFDQAKAVRGEDADADADVDAGGSAGDARVVG
jgi:hypothetical protein